MWLRLAGAAACVAACGHGAPRAPLPSLAPLQVWAVHDGEKIARDRSDGALARANAAWDGERVRIFAAKNEIVAFQVVVEADGAPARGVHVALPELRGSSSTIAYAAPDPDPTAYAGRPIAVFVEHSMRVREASRADWAWRLGSAAPREMLGEIPVQLVPENARRFGQPVDVPARTRQAFFIEVFVDRSRAACRYEGAISVRAEGRETRSIPIALDVYDFELPDRGLPAMLYFETSQLGLYHGREGALVDAYHRFAHRHRVELVDAYDVASLEAHRGRFDGADFTRARGYEGPAESVGNRIVPATFYGPGDDFDDRAHAWKTADAWMEAVERRVASPITFVYMPDEPREKDFPRIRTIAQNLASNRGRGRALGTFATSPFVAGLDGAIGTWCALATELDPARAKSERARGRQTWFYNGTRPSSGAMVIDAPATDPRVVGWAAFARDLDGYFFWHANHWRHNSQKPRDRDQRVWSDPITFDNREQPGRAPSDTGFLNGDGVLIYPGEERIHPEDDVGVPGPIGTIQLANLRRGLQDLLYLKVARERGREEAVAAALARIVPRVFSEVSPDEAPAFPQHGDDFERARRALAEAIALGVVPPNPPIAHPASEPRTR